MLRKKNTKDITARGGAAEALRDKPIVEEQLKKEQRIKEQQMLQYRDVKPATEADVNGRLEALQGCANQ